MEIKIWSDVRCPFCYIGKKHFDAALAKFEHKDKVQVEWKSYELDPELKTDPSLSYAEYLSSNKRMPMSQVEAMFAQIRESGKVVGLEMNPEAAIPSNTAKAHRLTHFATSKGSDFGDAMMEALFKAHFTDSLNIDDSEVLLELATAVGLDKEEVKAVLESDDFSYEVRQDQMEAGNIGVRGVPFFVLHKKFAVSGAQPIEGFVQALEKSWHYFEQDQAPIEILGGQSCDVDGNCE